MCTMPGTSTITCLPTVCTTAPAATTAACSSNATSLQSMCTYAVHPTCASVADTTPLYPYAVAALRPLCAAGAGPAAGMQPLRNGTALQPERPGAVAAAAPILPAWCTNTCSAAPP